MTEHPRDLAAEMAELRAKVAASNHPAVPPPRERPLTDAERATLGMTAEDLRAEVASWERLALENQLRRSGMLDMTGGQLGALKVLGIREGFHLGDTFWVECTDCGRRGVLPGDALRGGGPQVVPGGRHEVTCNDFLEVAE
jgi:hypothetical protein